MALRRICPRDSAPLVAEGRTAGRRTVQVDRCPTCNGIFLDVGEIKTLTSNRDLHRYLTKYLGIDSDSKLVCPSCGGLMDEEDCAGTVVDVCIGCKGLWLDGGELEELQKLHGDEFSTLSDEKLNELFQEAKVTGKQSAYLRWTFATLRRKRK